MKQVLLFLFVTLHIPRFTYSSYEIKTSDSVKIKTSNNDLFTIPIDIANKTRLLRSLLEDCDEQDQRHIPLIRVSTKDWLVIDKLLQDNTIKISSLNLPPKDILSLLSSVVFLDCGEKIFKKIITHISTHINAYHALESFTVLTQLDSKYILMSYTLNELKQMRAYEKSKEESWFYCFISNYIIMHPIFMPNQTLIRQIDQIIDALLFKETSLQVKRM